MFFDVRSQGPPATIISEPRDAVRRAAASLPLIGLKAQTKETSDVLTQQRLFGRLTISPNALIPQPLSTHNR